VEREHSGLRQIAGYGVTVTRGAASAMMFTYSTLLITMCRNTITMLRDTFLHIYIPFDSAVSFHKYIAIWALVFTGKFNYLKTFKWMRQVIIIPETTLKKEALEKNLQYLISFNASIHTDRLAGIMYQ
jgi:hypothetical protein